ncbi:hypothetical protein QMK19_38370 [Streptomyces sp. H10-C2]|uniref:hypothetical protein n=1 Tax=unclassified Streptomyces TaxID=2593676 RepID=UPI0024B9E703|nr:MULTISPECIES: hypothetical protein [unclassified Streptomyces]MDJ0347043.1 hypothetical protein [Streptomyces sp. PH10-H1]MDJ0375311.1 hypothetical protein [Streptomyces sp. H10-C2]
MIREPNRPDDIDTEGKAVPPYEGRRTSAHVKGNAEPTKGGVKTGGASGPVEDDDMKAPEPSRTRGGATGSPADEKAAGGSRRSPSGDAADDDGTGPAHQRGASRAEDQS